MDKLLPDLTVGSSTFRPDPKGAVAVAKYIAHAHTRNAGKVVGGSLAIVNHWQYGWPGVVKSLVFTGLMLCFAAIFTRLRVRMQL